jgi:phage FluMu protein Com
VKYVSCPQCGHKLLEAMSNSCVKVKCSKCNNIIQVRVKEDNVSVEVVKNTEDSHCA